LPVNLAEPAKHMVESVSKFVKGDETMAHKVTFYVPERPLGGRDIQFDVKKDEAMLGTLKVSRGGVVWRPRDNVYGYFLLWSKLDEVVARHHTSKRAL